MASRKGRPNKATAMREAAHAKDGILPLDYMLRTLRDEDQPHDERMKAAAAAAPYIHPRLANVDHKHGGLDGKPLNATITVEFVSAKKETR